MSGSGRHGVQSRKLSAHSTNLKYRAERVGSGMRLYLKFHPKVTYFLQQGLQIAAQSGDQ